VRRIDYGTLLLLAYPDQYDSLRQDPDLVDGAVEEILRMVALGEGGLLCYAHDDIELAGVSIRAGDTVLLTMSSLTGTPPRSPTPTVSTSPAPLIRTCPLDMAPDSVSVPASPASNCIPLFTLQFGFVGG
jgi:hypothetical protein